MKASELKVGLVFKYQGGEWKISTLGVEGYYGVTSLRTLAFISLSEVEITQCLK